MAQDSSKPEFWDSRYRDDLTPWDAGTTPAGFIAYARTLAAGSRVLIPGCGSAYEGGYLARNGFDVLAVDFSAAAVQKARRNLGDLGDIVRQADFFDFEYGKPYDVIYERAFLCALPRRIWAGYPSRCAQMLKPHGVIAGFFFFADNPKGPPFGTSQAELDGLMRPLFECIEDGAATDSIEVFSGRERWQVWRRNS